MPIGLLTTSRGRLCCGAGCKRKRELGDLSTNSFWNNGFTGAIRICNTGTNAINGWNISWNYGDATRVSNSWNANVTGSNPYTATPLSWNSIIQKSDSKALNRVQR